MHRGGGRKIEEIHRTAPRLSETQRGGSLKRDSQSAVRMGGCKTDLVVSGKQQRLRQISAGPSRLHGFRPGREPRERHERTRVEGSPSVQSVKNQ